MYVSLCRTDHREVAVRAVIVDDNAPFRVLAGRLLTAGGMVVVGEASTGAAALTVGVRRRPDVVLLDVVLLDVQLPDTDGFTVCRLLVEVGIPSCCVRCGITRARRPAAVRSGSSARTGCRRPRCSACSPATRRRKVAHLFGDVPVASISFVRGG